MRILTLILFFVIAPPIWAQDTVGGNLHAVINADGTISYFLKVTPGTIDKGTIANIKKPTIQQLIGGNETSTKAFQLVGTKNEVAGYYVTAASPETTEPVAMAIEGGYVAKAVPYDSLPETFDHVYKFTDPKGVVEGAWLPAGAEYGVSAIGVLLPTDWSTSKVSAYSTSMLASSRNIPVPKDDFIKSLRESMLQQAISLACKSRVIPKEIAVTASLSASVGFIIGGEGTISFQATWETAQLCKP
jgi:hypothetical protein